MNVVEVKHKQSDKLYWFEVPDELVKKIKLGTIVLCNTKRGPRKGTTTSTVINSEEIVATQKIIKVYNARRFVIKVDNIIIPYWYLETRPSKDKLIARINEFYDTGCFNTKIIINNDHVLKDGYTALMVAKMMGVKYLTVDVV